MPLGTELEVLTEDELGTELLLGTEELLGGTEELLGGTDELLGGTDELLGGTEELDRLVVTALDDTQLAAFTRPNGAGWVLQVLREIQLLLFSYPQPFVVVTHTG